MATCFVVNKQRNWANVGVNLICVRYFGKVIFVLSAIAVIQVIFWTEGNFCFISDCGNSFNCKLKKLIKEQISIFYSPSNALCSSDESVQIKHFKHHTFIGMFSPWFNLQIMNLTAIVTRVQSFNLWLIT